MLLLLIPDSNCHNLSNNKRVHPSKVIASSIRKVLVGPTIFKYRFYYYFVNMLRIAVKEQGVSCSQGGKDHCQL